MSDLALPTGARAVTLDGVETPAAFDAIEVEVRAIREATSLSAMSHVTRLRVSGEGAYDLLGRVCPADVNLRDGRVRHTLLLRDDASVLADLYLCNDDGAFILMAEGVASTALIEHLHVHARGATDVEVEDLAASHALLSLNGPFAWEVLAELEGPEVVGFPYLTLYHPTPDRTFVRAGKTGEYGYDLLVPRAEAAALWGQLIEVGRPFDLAPVGVEALAHCALENWFFDVHREGAAGLTPIELQLQWRLSPRKDDYVGAAALRARREAGITHRVTALRSETPMAAGDGVLLGDEVIGSVLHAARSLTLGDHIAVGLLAAPYAHSGIDRYTVRPSSGGAAAPVHTVSAPFVTNRSLFVNPQKHSYRERDAISYPAAVARDVGARASRPVGSPAR